MKVTILILLAITLGVFAQSNCPLSGPYECTGGQINGIDFGDDADDDFFRYFYTAGDVRMGDSCTLLQEGTYTVSGTTINTDFEIDDDECVIQGDAGFGCECVEPSLGAFTVTSADCQTISGPNGETCTASATCEEGFTCPSGQQPQADPNYTADFNGCGPSAFPITGPSFGFEECCIGHDICYGTCGTNKLDCDQEFYSCMYCLCQQEGNFLEREFCEEVACTYYELVDEFGCFSFNGGQEDACICPGKGAEHKSYSAMESAPSKFGSGSIKQTELFCDAPFEPAECPGSATSVTPSRTPASGSGSSSSRTRTPTRTPASGSSASRTPSRTRNVNTVTNDITSILTNTLTVTNPTFSNPLSPVTLTNPITSVNVDDDDSSASTLMVAVVAFFAVLLVL